MKTFDYESAWKELAKPEYDLLPQNVRDLYERVVLECGGLAQGKNLNMPWPEHGAMELPHNVGMNPQMTLRQLFDGTPAEVLALAARVIYSLGHWWPSKDIAGTSNPDKVGGAWKFANYADQSLAARLHTFPIGDPAAGHSALDPHWPDSGNGISFRVHEGYIGAQFSSPDSWTWHEIGLATYKNWETIQARSKPVLIAYGGTRRFDFDRMQDKFEKEYVPALIKLCAVDSTTQRFLDLSVYSV